MCGIVGQVLQRSCSPSDNLQGRRASLKKLYHRGPDNTGEYEKGGIWLGHTRLRILDLSTKADQPLKSADGRFVISYNGEIYNFRDLIETHSLSGLRSNSDTEVILELFAHYGPSVVSEFNGMFAIALLDNLEKKLWLFRDRIGIKPLYFFHDENQFCFSSEIAAIKSLDVRTNECDPSALHEWLYFGVNLGERTPYKKIQQLLPGHYLAFNIEEFSYSLNQYWSPVISTMQPPQEKLDLIASTRNIVERAVCSQLVSDVPVGIFLSGGIDSSAITAFASRHYSQKISTYSVGFDFDKGVNELPQARSIANKFQTDHHEIRVGGVDLADVVEKMIVHHGTPFSDAANIPLYLLSQKLQGSNRVILQGDGGDEMFGGYRRYTTLTYLKSMRFFAKIVKGIVAIAPKNQTYFRVQRYINALLANPVSETLALLMTEEDRSTSPENVFDFEFSAQFLSEDPFVRYKNMQLQFEKLPVVDQMMILDTMIILPDIFLEKVDRSTMASSVEVRVPFLDNDIVDFCMSLRSSQKIPRGQKKWLLKKSLEGILPKEILVGKKTGFGVPYGHWLKTSLRQIFFDNLQLFSAREPGILNLTTIERYFKEHAEGTRNHSFLLWKVFNFVLWANNTKVRFPS